MAKRLICARKANQQFSALLAATEKEGLTIVITRRGRVVARLVPEPPPSMTAVARDKSIDALFERYSRQMGGRRFSRDELYDRG